MKYPVLRTFVGDDCRVYTPGSLYPDGDREAPARIVEGLGSDGLIQLTRPEAAPAKKPAAKKKTK